MSVLLKSSFNPVAISAAWAELGQWRSRSPHLTARHCATLNLANDPGRLRHSCSSTVRHRGLSPILSHHQHIHSTPSAHTVTSAGWSGSRRYWDRALPFLQQRFPLIYALDLRWHGDSAAGAPPACSLPGCTVRRLAGDLYDFLRSDDVPQDAPVVLCGSSMGAAVIWAYIESSGQSRVAGCVFVDQAPLQNRAPDWDLGSKGAGGFRA